MTTLLARPPLRPDQESFEPGLLGQAGPRLALHPALSRPSVSTRMVLAAALMHVAIGFWLALPDRPVQPVDPTMPIELEAEPPAPVQPEPVLPEPAPQLPPAEAPPSEPAAPPPVVEPTPAPPPEASPPEPPPPENVPPPVPEPPPPPAAEVLPTPPKPKPPVAVTHPLRPPSVPRVAPAEAAPLPPAEHPIETQPSAAAPPSSPSAPADWQGALNAWIRTHKSYPLLARRRGEQGVVTLRFTVRRDGEVGQVTLVRGSGSAVLDEAAMSLLRRAHVPAFTGDMTQDDITVTVGLNYRLE